MISSSDYVKKSKTSIQNDLRREYILASQDETFLIFFE